MDMGMMMFGGGGDAALAPDSGSMGHAGTGGGGSGGGMGGGMQMMSGMMQGMMGMNEANANAKAMQMEALSLEQRAAEKRAAGQRQAMQRRLAGARLISKQLAIGAASGAGVTTPSLLDIMADTAQENEYHALGDMFVGESGARGDEDAANAKRYQAKIAKQRGMNAMFGGLLGGFGGSMRSSGGFSSYYGGNYGYGGTA